MTEAKASEDATAWRRRFAAASNNRAWDLASQTRNAAHASAWHWAQVGSALNRMRAIMLLAEVHALLGMGPSAVRYAEEMRSYFLAATPPDWELAFVHVIHAHAAAAAGETEKHRSSYALAKQALQSVSSAEERRNIASIFSHVPIP